MERVKHRRRGRTCGGEARTEKGETTDSRGDRDNGDGDRRQEGSSIGPCTDRVIRHASYLVDGIGQRSTVEGRRMGRRGEAKETSADRSDEESERHVTTRAKEYRLVRCISTLARARRCWNVLPVCVFITDSRESI